VNAYVMSGYGLTIGAIVLYALRVVLRGRTLARALRDEDDR
jgi:hypothetical protein